MEHQLRAVWILSCSQCEEADLREALGSRLWPHLPLMVEFAAVVLYFLGEHPSCGTKNKLLPVSMSQFLICKVGIARSPALGNPCDE